MTQERDIEDKLIGALSNLKYVYRSEIIDRNTLEVNFRKKFEALNKVTLTDGEFLRLRDEIIQPDVFGASKILRQQQFFEREDGTPLHYTLVNINDWCKNDYEVISQLRINTENSHQRYDVILLINGLPLVQIELKRFEISHRKAIQQIVEYKNEPGNGYSNSLLCFMQLFIVSNGSKTIYFANNNNKHFDFNADEQFLPVYQYADKDNNKINDLDEFTEQFLPKCTVGELISKYMVLVESEQKILVMRPYQIYAVEAIVDCIKDNKGNGYIWHTTGSGKTLTSFKASTLLKQNPDVDKCLFVVDRKDLDRQTREEFNKFQEGSVEENTNTETLVRRLLSEDYADKVIVTTIQKLGLALDGTTKNQYKEQLEPLSNKRIVFIFDECHRSQFGENHKAIKEFFSNTQLFGFTGTPIFGDNATYETREGQQASYKTTEDIFEKQLHAYTITHAIEDRNVLKFNIDHYKGEGSEQLQSGNALAQQAVVNAILEKHNAVTFERKFNALLATSSIDSAIQYYERFKQTQKQKQSDDSNYTPLNITAVFSPPAQLTDTKNAEDIKQIQQDLTQENEDNKHNPEAKKQALEHIIADYNKQYGTSHTINEFDLYYKDVQSRIKNHKYPNHELEHSQKIDITIVVDMLLTGFDSKYLNTLYVDKKLKYHGLIQAFSRTNRVLNDTKPNGNILDFKMQKAEVDQAIMLFSGVERSRAQEIWMVEPASKVIEKYKEAVEKLGYFMDGHNLVREPQQVYNLQGNTAKISFIKNFKEIQRLKIQLDQYTDIDDTQKKHIEQILPQNEFLKYRSSYIETSKELRSIEYEQQDHTPEEIQQLDYEYVLFASNVIDTDYIFGLLAQNMGGTPTKHSMSKEEIKLLLRSDAKLMAEEEDLSQYIDQLDWNTSQNKDALIAGFNAFLKLRYDQNIERVAHQIGLNSEEIHNFVDGIIVRMIFDAEKLTDLLAPLELNWKQRREKELALMNELIPILRKRANGKQISGLNAYDD